MAKCYICGCNLDIEKTRPEHIIPNGIGGKLKSKEILCNKHNNELFELDQIVCNTLEFHTNRLNPSRDNGQNPSTICELPSGEKVKVEPNGEYFSLKPIFKVNELEDGKIQITFSTFYSTNSQHKSFAINRLKEIYKGIAHKNGISDSEIEKNLDKIVEDVEKNIKTVFNPILHFQFEFNSSGKLFIGLAKIALDYYFYNNLPKKNVKTFLKKFNEKDISYINKHSNYYYADDFFPNNSIYHTLILKGDTNNKILYCIISLYGVLNCIIFLNKNYTGNDFIKTYSYDLRNKEIAQFNKNPNLNKDIVEKLLERTNFYEKIKIAQCNFMRFFEYGNNLELQNDLKDFDTNLQNDFDNLQKKPIINSLIEYEKTFRDIFYQNVHKNKTLQKCTKYEIQGLYKKIYDIFPYEKYLQPYILKITNDIILKSIQNILFNNPELINDNNKLIQTIIDFYSNIKTNNLTINLILEKNFDVFKDCVHSFIFSIKPQLEYYRDILYKSANF